MNIANDIINRLFSCGQRVLKLVIDGEPIPQARPRFGKMGRVYEPTKCTKAKANIRAIAEREMKAQGFAMAHKDMPIILECKFFSPLPSSKQKWWKVAARLGLIPCMSRNSGDIDNKIKLCLDGINGTVMYDDSQVCEVHAYSRYSDNPRTEVTIKALYVNVGDIKAYVNKHKEEEQ